MIRPIRAIKKEIRTVGLDLCNPRLNIGVVVRGGLYLDGVISFPHLQKNTSRALAKRIIESAYHPELRAIMLHNPRDDLNTALVERITNLPTISISKDEPHVDRGYKVLDGNLGPIWVKTRLNSTILKKILAETWAIGKLPEPLRIAHLLARLDLLEKSSG